MNKILFVPLVAISSFAFSQKSVVVKGGKIKVNDAVTAEFDGKGGMLKTYRLGVFAPGSKDSIFTVYEELYNANYPLFDNLRLYKLTFSDVGKTSFYIKKKDNGWTAEKGVMEQVFNDTLPRLIKDGKLDTDSLNAFKAKVSFDLDAYKTYLKTTQDSVGAEVKNTVIKRDSQKPFVFKPVKDKLMNNNKPHFNDAELVYDIYQDNVLLGRLEKVTHTTITSTSYYTYYKYIGIKTVNGMRMLYAPVAVCVNEEGFSGNKPVDVLLVNDGQTFSLRREPNNVMDLPILESLFAKGYL